MQGAGEGGAETADDEGDALEIMSCGHAVRAHEGVRSRELENRGGELLLGRLAETSWRAPISEHIHL